jgi:flavin reductase (DIM6/NTAB) family NADH-FMN oxidoreductase RutF
MAKHLKLRISQRANQNAFLPRIAEAFLSLECTFEKELDLSGSGKAALLIGHVNHIAVQEEYALGIHKKYENDGFMHFIYTPKNIVTEEGQSSTVE